MTYPTIPVAHVDAVANLHEDLVERFTLTPEQWLAGEVEKVTDPASVPLRDRQHTPSTEYKRTGYWADGRWA